MKLNTLIDDFNRCAIALNAAILCDVPAKISQADSDISEIFEEILSFDAFNSAEAKQLTDFLLERLLPVEGENAA